MLEELSDLYDSQLLYYYCYFLQWLIYYPRFFFLLYVMSLACPYSQISFVLAFIVVIIIIIIIIIPLART